MHSDLERLTIDPDIRRAETPPGWLYTSAEVFEAMRNRIFRRTWHAFPDAPIDLTDTALTPWPLHGDLAQLLLSAQDRRLSCLSNVCTHRGHLLVDTPCRARTIRCRYHGRRFDHAGRCTGAPGFDASALEAADLPRVALASYGPVHLASLAPAHTAETLLAPLEARLGFLPIADAQLAGTRRYRIDASWLLYVDNYLEGFHIPFVHPGLSCRLRLDTYRTELLPRGTLQLVEAREDEPAIAPPAGHPDHGKRIAGYYAYLYPCTMLNFYPWGLSVNVVLPLGPKRTEIAYQTWVWDEDQRGHGAGGDLDTVEREDQEVVLSVQRGLASPLYKRGRYAPNDEVGVHHVHRLVTQQLATAP